MHKSIFHAFFMIACVTFLYIFFCGGISVFVFFPGNSHNFRFVFEGFPVNLKTKIASYCLLGK